MGTCDKTVNNLIDLSKIWNANALHLIHRYNQHQQCRNECLTNEAK